MVSNVFAECAVVGSLKNPNRFTWGFDEKMVRVNLSEYGIGLKNSKDVKH